MKRKQQEQKLHDFYQEAHLEIFGISSELLTQFAVVFSALIYDINHTGYNYHYYCYFYYCYYYHCYDQEEEKPYVSNTFDSLPH